MRTPIQDLRFVRNELLKGSDWTQLPDSPLSTESKAAWASYRQALRDLPASDPDLNDPAWPEKPE